jgi:hypothetical protein
VEFIPKKQKCDRTRNYGFEIIYRELIIRRISTKKKSVYDTEVSSQKVTYITFDPRRKVTVFNFKRDERMDERNELHGKQAERHFTF